MEACPGRETPEPSALDTTSIKPPLTGVPCAKPAGGARGDASCDVRRSNQPGQLLACVLDTIERKQSFVIAALRHAQQAAAAHVRDLGHPLAGQPVRDEVLAQQHRMRGAIQLGPFALDPREQDRRLRWPRLLQAQRVQRIPVSGGQLVRESGGARVERLDPTSGLRLASSRYRPLPWPAQPTAATCSGAIAASAMQPPITALALAHSSCGSRSTWPARDRSIALATPGSRPAGPAGRRAPP